MELEAWHAPQGDAIPNHPRFAVLLFRGTGLHDADAARERFADNGWGGAWVDGVFDFHHFHSTSHGVLAVVVLPAGTGHRRATADGALVAPPADPVGGAGVASWR